jgi:poly-gamma-glutamate capsule biosynthesis protein CapA/YwtB (metallophosphatase superfamily)
LVVFALHTHETRSGAGTDHRPADFVSVLFHDAIDAGADVGLATGLHVLRGVEVYRGKPILYGLGSLFLELGWGGVPDAEIAEALGVDPEAVTATEFVQRRFAFPDAWYDSMIAVSEFRGGELAELRLHPLRLERSEGFRLQGSPRLAQAADARRILAALAGDSAEFGTGIRLEGDLGIVQSDG